MRRGPFLLLILAFGASLSGQPTLNVPGAYPTIQAAVNAATPGAIVLVAPGVWPGPLDFLGKAITVRSAQGPAVTTLSGLAASVVVAFQSGETATSVLDGFTVRNGGPGIYCFHASPTIRNCVITQNFNFAGYGGGLRLHGLASPVVEACVLAGNLALDFGAGAGGVNWAWPPASPATPLFTDTTFIDNVSLGYSSSGSVGGGGGAGFTGSIAPTFERCTFDGNSSFEGGGAIGFDCEGAFAVRTCLFRDNATAVAGGGAIIVRSNGAPSSILNSVFHGNQSGAGGGAIRTAVWGSLPTAPAVTIAGCTVTANTADAISCGLPTIVVNTIAWGNVASDVVADAGVPVTISTSLVGTGLTAGPGNLTADPLFVDPAGNDFHLSRTSPCRDTAAPLAGFPPTDIDGTPRIAGAAADIGADEIPVSTWPGTGEALDAYVDLDGSGDPLASVTPAPPLTLLRVRLRAHQPALAGTSIVLGGDLHPSGSAMPPLPGFPGLHLSTGLFLMWATGPAAAPGTPGLPAAGALLEYQVPPGLSGMTLRLQAIALTPLAQNGLYATSPAREIQFVP